ncbi:hypothetical protein MRX96_030738 [Rhipicephalus microplus]
MATARSFPCLYSWASVPLKGQQKTMHKRKTADENRAQGDTAQEWGRREEGMLAWRGQTARAAAGRPLSQHGAFPSPSDKAPNCFCSAQITDPLLDFPTMECGAYLQNLRMEMPAGMCSPPAFLLFQEQNRWVYASWGADGLLGAFCNGVTQTLPWPPLKARRHRRPKWKATSLI